MEKLRRATEDYLKTIYLLGGSQLRVRCVDIANRLGISRASVSVAVKRLCDEGYLVSDATHQVRLTESGLAVAQNTLEKNQTIRALLLDFGVDEENADRDACRIEHDISPASFAAMQDWWSRRQREERTE